jgi:hypothetical protein
MIARPPWTSSSPRCWWRRALLSIGGQGLEEGGERAQDAESDEDEGDGERPARLEGLVPVAARYSSVLISPPA